jgi:hypothetical protein
MSEQDKNVPPEPRKLPDGISHIEGPLYKVRFDLIKVADKPDTEAKAPDKYQWFNPRYWTLEEGEEPAGFGKPDMDRLGEDIRDNGLTDPMLCRWIPGPNGTSLPQLWEGERRKRKIDFFRKKKEKVKNPTTGEYENAEKVYEYVLCNIYDIDKDIEVLKRAYRHARTRVNFSPEVDLRLVMEMRSEGAKDEEILDVTGQDEKWLANMDKLIALKEDTKTLKAFCDGTLKLESAVAFAECEDQGTRHKALDIALTYAGEDSKKKIAKLEKDILKGKEDVQLALGKKAEAEFKNDDGKLQEAATEEEAAQGRVQAAQKKKEKTNPQVGPKTARKAIQEAKGGNKNGTGEEPRPISASGIRKKYLGVVVEAIKAEGNDPEGKFLAHVDLLAFARDLFNGILKGEEEPTKIFRKHGKKFNEEWKKK